MPTSPPTIAMLNTKMLVNTSLIASWLPVITYLLQLTSGVLNDQLEALQTQITTLVNTPTPTNQAAGTVIIPFTLVQNMQNAFNNYQNISGGGFARNDYSIVRSNVNSLLDQAAARYWNSSRPTQLFVLAGADEAAEPSDS